MKSRAAAFLAPPLLLLSACHQGTQEGGGAPGDLEDTHPFSQISDSEVLQFTGTEPFWGGEVSGDTLTYSTPENQDGTQVPVTRFAGRNGLSFTGTYQGGEFVMMVTPGDCSDGMSDRTYPFVATLKVGDETRYGCAWSDEHPFEGPDAP